MTIAKEKLEKNFLNNLQSLFLKDDSKVTLEEIKVCTAVTEVLDKHIKSLYKDFDASLYNDTFETLYNYHKHLDENKD